MANIKSQIKRNRQNDKRRLRNRVYRGQARTAIKDARFVIESQDAEAAKKALLEAISTLDKAAEQGVLHKNNAARRKSRLMKQFNKMEPAQAQPAAETVEAAAPAAEEKKAAPRKRAAKKAEAK